MSRYHILWALASAFLFAAPVFADEKAPPEQIRLSIQNLGNPRFAVREQAARDLIRAGEPALAELKAAVASKDEEVRLRAENIVRIIQARAENETMIRAPKLRVKFEAKPLDEAIADVNRQTGLTFALDQSALANAKQPVTVDTGDVPYWEAVERFLAAAGLVENPAPVAPALPNQQYQQLRARRRINGGPADPRILLIKCMSPPAAATATLVRVKALPSSVAGSSVTKGTNEINFVLDVTPSPALTWTGLADIEVSRAVDERDVVLEQSHLRSSGGAADSIYLNNNMQAQVFGGQVVFIQGGGRVIVNGGDYEQVTSLLAPGNPRHVRVTLLGKTHASKTLKELSGVVTANVMTPPLTLLTVDNLLTASTKEPIRAGNYQIQITERKSEKSYLQLRFRLTTSFRDNGIRSGFANPNMNGMIIDSDEILNNPQSHIVFQDSSGNIINNVAVNPTDQSFDGENQITDYVAVIPVRGTTTSAVKLVLNGRKSLSIEVPFVLKNVPLP